MIRRKNDSSSGVACGVQLVGLPAGREHAKDLSGKTKRAARAARARRRRAGDEDTRARDENAPR